MKFFTWMMEPSTRYLFETIKGLVDDIYGKGGEDQ